MPPQPPKTMQVFQKGYEDGGLCTINEADFDPELHVDPEAVEKPKASKKRSSAREE